VPKGRAVRKKGISADPNLSQAVLFYCVSRRENGLAIRSRLSMTMPSCMSSDPATPQSV